MFVILSACLIASPATCKEDRIQQSVEERSPQACLIEGQSTVAEWGVSHPQWQSSNGCAFREAVSQPIFDGRPNA